MTRDQKRERAQARERESDHECECDLEREHGPAGESLLGLLDGRPVSRAGLDRRLAALRAGPRASALPVPGTTEDRQLVRWGAQVLLTELLCETEAAERGLNVSEGPPARLDQRAAVELGSINAAAFEGSAAVRAVYEAVTAGVAVPAEQVAAYTAATARPPVTEWRLSTPDGEFDAAPHTLPERLMTALAAAGPGRAVTVDGYTATLLGVRTASRPSPDTDDGATWTDPPMREPSTPQPTREPSTVRLAHDPEPSTARPAHRPSAECHVREPSTARHPHERSMARHAHELPAERHVPEPSTVRRVHERELFTARHVHELSAERHVADATRRLIFVRWLDQARARRLRLVPGLEHPGDPAQPDNHHRH
jgi:[acyl-carrier-protein] S-malonyltransferase